ncbi:hypothetical protein ACNQGP_03990 [Flavobacterium sp. GT2N3]|uniref:hypothetical protein n=1 Tax=unclassified Flavobacterium TaxID=196869 RepID=UPI003AB08213
MNLNNINLVELNAQEVQQVDGGTNGFWVAVGNILGIIATTGEAINNHHNSEIVSNFQSCAGGEKI